MMMAIDAACIGQRRLGRELVVRETSSRCKSAQSAQKISTRRGGAAALGRGTGFSAGTERPCHMHGVPLCTFSELGR